MLEFELLDETFDLNRTQEYTLSIQAGPDGFSFVIYDPSPNKVTCLKSHSFREKPHPDRLPDLYQEIIGSDPILGRPYKKIHTILEESRSTLLPAALFNRDHLKSYFEFNHELSDLDEIHYNYLKHVDAYLVFPVHQEISMCFLKSWMSAKYYHQATPFIENALLKSQHETRASYILFQVNHFDIIVIEDLQLKFHNNFSFRTGEDLVYFILFVYDKLGLDQEKDPVYLSGKIDKRSKNADSIRQYLKQVIFIDLNPDLRYSPAVEKPPPHLFSNLMNLNLYGE